MFHKIPLFFICLIPALIFAKPHMDHSQQVPIEYQIDKIKDLLYQMCPVYPDQVFEIIYRLSIVETSIYGYDI